MELVIGCTTVDVNRFVGPSVTIGWTSVFGNFINGSVRALKVRDDEAFTTESLIGCLTANGCWAMMAKASVIGFVDVL